MLRAVLLVLLWISAPADRVAAEQPKPEREDTQWRGRAVCVDAVGAMQPCAPEGNRHALRLADGSLRWFMPDDPLAPVFDDARIRDQDVVVTVRPRPDGTGEMLKVYSTKHGKLHDVRYFCEICNVTSFTPGLCPCCRAEMELKETPID